MKKKLIAGLLTTVLALGTLADAVVKKNRGSDNRGNCCRRNK